jgi:signal transduction histidine kinase
LSNALKYSPQGGLIRCQLECPENRLCVAIQDDGIGIPEEELAFLFDSFHRAANVGTIPGTGLGLAIVKKCVDVHQGQISVESRVGQGTCFRVTLPSVMP